MKSWLSLHSQKEKRDVIPGVIGRKESSLVR
jgi:hypothetical protein